MTQIPQGVPQAGAPKSSGAAKGCLGVILAPILLMGGCTAWVALSPKDTQGSAEASAIVACRNAVRDRLKAPTTADFSADASASKSSTGYSVTVFGTVDSENSFGAKIRSSFTCTVQADSDGDAKTVRVDSLG